VDFVEPVLMTPTVLTQLHLLGTLAPLHQPQSLAAIEIINTIKPDLRQIACFDTAFHAKHHPLFNHYALPDSMRQQGIRRYGFHGLSYEWIVQELKSKHPELYRGRVIAAHLGNGASLCAIQRGASIDTTMGMTALDGLPMGTRCGSIDPGAVIYMMRELGLSAQRIEEILYNESGLLALSGISYDARQLLASRKAEAKFALDFFALKTAQFIAMMAVSVGGIDGIVFTGGIGENMSTVRDDILAYLQFLRPFDVHIIPANEERIMAQHAVTVLGNLRQV
jgi:acetate kinase